MNAQTALTMMTDNGLEFMAMVGRLDFDFFDDGVTQGSGNYGNHMASQFAQATGKPRRSVSGIMSRLASDSLGLWKVTPDQESVIDGPWWSLTALGAEVATLAAQAGTEAEPAAEQPVSVDEFAAAHDDQMFGSQIVTDVTRPNFEYAAENADTDSARAYYAALLGN